MAWLTYRKPPKAPAGKVEKHPPQPQPQHLQSKAVRPQYPKRRKG